jgi:hypothetical protein
MVDLPTIGRFVGGWLRPITETSLAAFISRVPAV